MDVEVRTGGKPVLRVAGQAEPDLTAVLAGGGLADAARRLGAATDIEAVIGPSGRTDHLVQRLAGATPDEVRAIGLPDDFLAEQFSSPLGSPDLDVVILSAASDIQGPQWAGPGGVVRCPDDFRSVWSPDVVAAFDEAFEEAPLPTAEAYAESTRAAIAAIKAASNAHVLLLGVSTLGVPRVTSYAGRDDDHRLRAHRVNAVQLRLSMELGVSVIDVDRVVANYGGAGQVDGPFGYSPAVASAICDEIASVLADIGFFEKRPLVEQVGRAS